MVAPLYDVLGHPLLGERFTKLPDDDSKVAYNVLAELLLGLVAPPYTDGDIVDQLEFAIVRQINFLLIQGVDPLVNKTVSQSTPALMTEYRERYVDPSAASIVRLVTGQESVRFAVPGRGV